MSFLFSSAYFESQLFIFLMESIPFSTEDGIDSKNPQRSIQSDCFVYFRRLILEMPVEQTMLALSLTKYCSYSKKSISLLGLEKRISILKDENDGSKEIEAIILKNF
ncbi:MAG: hypothetical protein AB1756_01375 [Acidobacteriota bacterium]